MHCDPTFFLSSPSSASNGYGLGVSFPIHTSLPESLGDLKVAENNLAVRNVSKL